MEKTCRVSILSRWERRTRSASEGNSNITDPFATTGKNECTGVEPGYPVS